MSLEALAWWRKDTWTYGEIFLLWDLSKQGLPLKEIVYRMGKSESAVMLKARELEVPLADLTS